MRISFLVANRQKIISYITDNQHPSPTCLGNVHTQGHYPFLWQVLPAAPPPASSAQRCHCTPETPLLVSHSTLVMTHHPTASMLLIPVLHQLRASQPDPASSNLLAQFTMPSLVLLFCFLSSLSLPRTSLSLLPPPLVPRVLCPLSSKPLPVIPLTFHVVPWSRQLVLLRFVLPIHSSVATSSSHPSPSAAFPPLPVVQHLPSCSIVSFPTTLVPMCFLLALLLSTSPLINRNMILSINGIHGDGNEQLAIFVLNRYTYRKEGN